MTRSTSAAMATARVQPGLRHVFGDYSEFGCGADTFTAWAYDPLGNRLTETA